MTGGDRWVGIDGFGTGVLDALVVESCLSL